MTNNSVILCPVCHKPFEEDEEVGPVPACECGDRGKEELQPPPDDPGETGETIVTDGEFQYPVRPAHSFCRLLFEPRKKSDEDD